MVGQLASHHPSDAGLQASKWGTGQLQDANAIWHDFKGLSSYQTSFVFFLIGQQQMRLQVSSLNIGDLYETTTQLRNGTHGASTTLTMCLP
jgi:hypothetical protein